MRSERPPGDSCSDQELWVAGDPAAFALLYERHAEAVWNHAYRLTASWSAADDLLGVVFLTAWRRRTDVRLVNESALPWLRGVTATAVRNERRRLSRYLRAMTRLPKEEAAPDPAEEIAQRSEDRHRLASVLDAVRRLPRRERAAIELCVLGRTTVAEAAVVLGVTEGGLRSSLSRAKRRIREVVGHDWEI